MAKSINYPKKETINLAMKEKRNISFLKLIPGVIIIAIVAGMFSKFAVMDLLSGLYRLQQEENDIARQIEVYTEGLADYDDVLVEYTHRSNDWMSVEELMQVDYDIYYPMVERCVIPYSDIESVSIQQNMMSLNLINLSLSDASSIIKALSERDDVVSVSINTANREKLALTNERNGAAVLVVLLTNGYEPPPEPTEDLAGEETTPIAE